MISAASLIADSTNPSGAALSVTSVGHASHGTVSMVNGNIAFVPAANFSGIATFDYTLSDATGHSSTATVTVDVAPVADAPALSASLGIERADPPITKVGAEFTANTTTAGGQFFSTVSTFADGGYVISWTDTSYTEVGPTHRVRRSAPRSSMPTTTRSAPNSRSTRPLPGGQYRSQIAILDQRRFRHHLGGPGRDERRYQR